MEDERFEHTKWRVRGIRERRELRKQEERLNLLDEQMSVWMVSRSGVIARCLNPFLPNPLTLSCPNPNPAP